MSLFHMPNPSNNFYHDWKARKLLYLFVFLVVFLSACGLPKNVILLNGADPIPAAYLVWSPTGNELAVTAITVTTTNEYPMPKSAIYILDVKTKKMRLVVDQDFGDVSAYGWMPDGKQLAFSGFSLKDSKKGIWLVDISSVKPPKFFSDHLQLTSFDGKIAIPRTDPSTQEDALYIHNITTNDETKIFSGMGLGISQLSWSSDGSKLVFLYEKSHGGKYGIYLFDANTKKTIQVVPDGNIKNPSLSPNGEMIAYTKANPNSFLPSAYLHIIKSDGSCDVEVPGHFEVYSPVWSPDGKQIAYIGKSDRGIYLLDLIGAFGEDIIEKGLPCP